MISVAGIYSVTSETLAEDVEKPAAGVLSGLALGVFYVLVGAAHPVFPGSSHSGPSPQVRIDRTSKPLYDGHLALFPIEVDWKVWDQVVVPVLEDARWVFSNPLNLARVSSGEVSGLVYELEIVLYRGLQAAGYIP